MATDTVEQIKERLGIQEVIAPYVKLTRAGKSLRERMSSGDTSNDVPLSVPYNIVEDGTRI